MRLWQQIFVIVVGLFVAGVPLSRAKEEVTISEFMAINDTGLQDAYGDRSDWIEIHNASTSTVNLAGWFLTDKASKPDKWRFPAVTVEPDGYLVVFASGRDKRNARAELHTNFKLSGGGEYLALVRPDGTIAREFAPEYPVQVADVSYGIVDHTVSNLVVQGDDAIANSPTSEVDFAENYVGWNTQNFTNTATWQAGHTGIGYDRNAGYGAWLGSGGNIEALTRNKNKSAFMRVPFSLSTTNRLSALILRMRFDDGFRAFLNGVPVAEFSAPSNAAWNSGATKNREEALNNDWTVFDISAYTNLLAPGTNVLAFQMFNITLTSSDLLVLPELDAWYDTSSAGAYLQYPTPGAENAPGRSDIGPIIRDTLERPPRPSGATNSPALVVTTKVVEALSPVQSVTLYYRQMFSNEVAVPMTAGSNGLYTAAIPVAGLGAGKMVRWRIGATDTRGVASTDPAFFGQPDYQHYYGTVTTDSSYSNSLLPVVEWFVEDYAAAGTRGGTSCCVYYLNRFYDNVLISLHGQSSSTFSKKSYNLDFPRDHRFLYQKGKRRVKDLRWMQNWADKTKVHITMSCETAKRVGAAYMFAFPVRLQKNGEFDRITEFMEDGDDRWLERLGRDPNGYLLKMYSETNGEKKTRRVDHGEVTQAESDADEAARAALFSNLETNQPIDSRRLYVYDNMNIPDCLNYLVAANIFSHQDHGHKNYYTYRDTNDSKEWSIFLWDLDLTWGRNWTGSYFDDHLYANNSLTFNTPQQNKVYNRIYQIFHKSPELRQIYLRRLRTCMDEILQPESVPVAERVIENRFEYWMDMIDPTNVTPSDADLDRQKWGYWGTDRTPREEWARTKTEYLDARRGYLFDSNPEALTVEGESVPASQPTNSVIKFETVDYLPESGDGMQEYFTLLNTNDYAVDISGWKISGAVDYTFPPGTVIPSGSGTNQNVGRLFVARRSADFRARPVGPSSAQYCFVQGGYKGQLSARGETLVLADKNGRVVDSLTYTGTPTDSQMHLRVSEIMYKPSAPSAEELAAQPYLLDTDFEYIELVNTGTNTIDLGGARFSQGVQFTFPTGATLNAGSYLVVAANTNAFKLRYGSGARVAGQYDGYLDNSGETIVLLDSVGEKVLDFSYNDKWYPLTAGNDFSLVIRDENAAWQSWGEATSWRASSNFRGSPGYADPLPAASPPVYINEVLTHTDLPQVDSVELFNAGSTAIDIGGWFLSDDFFAPKKFRIPDGTMLSGGGYLFFDEYDFNADTNSPTAFQLSSTGDDIWLFAGNARTNLTGYYHGFEFGAASNGVSFGRYITSVGKEHFPAQKSLTLGAANSGPRVGPVVISEIMYHPPDINGENNERDEYIELTNISSNRVALFGPGVFTNVWHIRNAVDFDFPPGTTMRAGEKILVVNFDPTDHLRLRTLRIVYGVTTNTAVYGPWKGNLNNGGETIELKRPDNPNTNDVPYIMVEKVHYHAREPWPPSADGSGKSLQRIDPDEYGNDPDDWYAAAPTAGEAADLALDSDGDGMTDWAEWKARTDPESASSNMRLSAPAHCGAGEFDIPMHTVAGRRYMLEYSTNLTTAPFQIVIDDIEAIGDLTTVTVTNRSGTECYYRMRLHTR